jgi:two-component sensor histidine kinase
MTPERSETERVADGLIVRELSHRIRNELEAAISVASLTANRSTNEETKAALAAVIDVLFNFATVHRSLEMPRAETQLDGGPYLRSLCQCISRARLCYRNIDLLFIETSVTLSAHQCWLLGMITSELITNAERHAFDDNGGTIRVELATTPDLVKCVVSDDGHSEKPWGRGEGTGIIAALAKALDGELVQTFGDEGSTSILAFPRGTPDLDG